MKETSDPISRKERILAKALTTMLKPLVRLLIQQNITYVGLQDLLKRTFVEVADESFRLPGKKQTDSRISLLTAVHRADVKRIRASLSEGLSEKEIKASVSAQMMSVWLGHQAYLNEQGQPSALYRQTSDGAPNFEELVLSVSKDKHPRSVLDEWLSQGVVSILENGQIQLNESGYIPEEDFEEKLFFAGKNIGSHLSVVAYNLENQIPPMFDRAIYYKGLSAESVHQLETLSKQKMMAVLTEINQKALQLQENDVKIQQTDHEMHLGVYLQRDEAHSEDIQT